MSLRRRLDKLKRLEDLQRGRYELSLFYRAIGLSRAEAGGEPTSEELEALRAELDVLPPAKPGEGQLLAIARVIVTP